MYRFSRALACVFFTQGAAFAQQAPATPTPPGSDLVSGLITALSSTITESLQSLTQNEGFSQAGEHLTLMIFAIVFAWGLIENMVSGDGVNGVVAEFVSLCATASIIYSFLSFGGVSTVVKFMESVASVFGAEPDLGKDILAALQKGFAAIINVATIPSSTTNIPFSLGEIGAAIGVGINSLISILARLVTAFILVIALAVYIANIVLAHGSIMLAVALAPLMSPFLMAPATTFIFDGWLKFFLSSAMIKVVGAFMIAFTDRLMGGLVIVSEKIKLPANADFAEIATSSIIVNMGLILLAGLSAYLMMQVPSLANGLIRGVGGQFGFSMGAVRSPPMPQIGRAGAK